MLDKYTDLQRSLCLLDSSFYVSRNDNDVTRMLLYKGVALQRCCFTKKLLCVKAARSSSAHVRQSRPVLCVPSWKVKARFTFALQRCCFAKKLLHVEAAVEQPRHIPDSQGQILALTFRYKSFLKKKLSSLRSETVHANWPNRARAQSHLTQSTYQKVLESQPPHTTVIS